MTHLLRGTKPKGRRTGPWTLALALAVVASLVVISAGPSLAGSRAAGPASPTSSSGVEAVPSPGSLAAAEINQEMDFTIHLPLVLGGNPEYPEFPDPPFGVQLFDTNSSLSDKLVDMGAKWVRWYLIWEKIEPANTTPENYSWPARFESELACLGDEGVNVILTLTGNPSWAAQYPAGPLYPGQMGELVEFMEAVVGRYSAPPYRVKYWEMYNEPDNGAEWGCTEDGVGCFGNHPEAYVELLQSVYQPIKDVDPEAQIVFGGMAYDAFDDPWGGPFVRAFLDDVLADGGGDYFDVMNFHYYLAFSADWAPYGIDILGKYNYLRDKLASYGMSKPFICSETAMWSDAANGGSDELQSRYVAQVFARSMAGGLQSTIWFKLVDDAYAGTHKWGLLDTDFEPKPAYWAYQTLGQQLGGAVFVRTWPPTETGSSAVEAYEFGPDQGTSWPDGTVRIVVTWNNDEAQHLLELQADSLVQVDKYGVETPVQDGDDGQVDGLIHLIIGPSPVYLRLPQ